MRDVALVVGLAITISVVPLAADAQQPGKIVRICFLSSAPLQIADAFRAGMRELGYVEGQHFVIVYRSSRGRYERFPDLAAELVRSNVDVIVASNTPAALAAKQATTTIPITTAAKAIEIQLQLLDVRDPGDFEGAFSAMATGHAGALFAVDDAMLFTHRSRVVNLVGTICQQCLASGSSRTREV